MTDTGVTLQKGERFNLTKGGGGDTAFYVGLSWDEPTAHNSAFDFDLDVSAFACEYDANEDPKLISDKHFIFFNNLKAPDGSIIHAGDNRTGAGDGDDEMIRFYLDKMDARVREISIIVDIYDAASRGQNFGMVRKGKIRICRMDAQGNPTEELAKFNLSEDYSAFSAVQPGSIYKRDDGEWAFNPTGAGFAGGLQAATQLYRS